MLKLGRGQEYRTRSNTKVKREGEKADRPGYVWDTYQPSPVMSTYLLAWVVSKYESAKNMSARGVKFEAFYSDASLVQRAADVGAKMLDHFEQKVFGIKYNLPKIDIVAVEKFSGAAMENWGMMTFNNKFVLHSPDWKSSDIFDKDLMMAHELVHHYLTHLTHK